MKLAQVLQLDDSDYHVFEDTAASGEWAIPGAFAFSNWTEAELEGKAKQAFQHGWLGLDSFGRATVVAVTSITEAERSALIDKLAFHFCEAWGAPSVDAALPVATEEIDHMIALCEAHPDNTLIVVERTLDDMGVREKFRLIPPKGASLDTFAVHGDY